MRITLSRFLFALVRLLIAISIFLFALVTLLIAMSIFRFANRRFLFTKDKLLIISNILM